MWLLLCLLSWLLLLRSGVVVVGGGCFHFRLTGSLVSGEGALKRFKLAAPTHRLRVYPRENPQPRKRPRAQDTRRQGGTQRENFDHGRLTALHHLHNLFRNHAVIQLKQTGVPPGVWGRAPPRSVGLCGVVSAVASCPRLSNTVAGTETNSRDLFDHGSRMNLHHFHDFFHSRGTAEATRDVTTLDHGRRADLHTVHDLFHNQRTGWRDTKIFVSLSARVEREQSTKNCENGTVH